MSRLFAGLAAIALLCAVPHAARTAPAPGSVDPAPTPPPIAPPAATPPPGTAPAVTPPPIPPTTEATPPAKPEAKKPAKRRYARYRHGYPYWRRDPFYYWHPRFWRPYRHQRYRNYRHHRRHYYRPFPFFMFRW